MHSVRTYACSIFVLFFSFTLMCQHAAGQGMFSNSRVTMTAPKTYKGNLQNVTLVTFKSALFGKKNKGEFRQTDEKEWTETATTGVFYWFEVGRKNNCISLLDTVGDERLELQLAEKQVNKSVKSGDIVLYMIHDIEETAPADRHFVARQQAPPPAPVVVPEPVVTNTVTKPTPVVETKPAQPIAQTTPVDIPELANAQPVYHAILIAEDTYEDKTFNELPGTLRDVRKIYSLLTTKYTFDPANVDTMVNSSKESILRRLNAVAKNLGENDNLFVFYAGHGWLKKYEDGRQEGFLIPSDAAKGEEVSFIDNQDITVIIKRSNAKHILFAADACFAGAFFRDITADAPLSVSEAYKDKSRKLLSSGNEQAVSDESDFVEYLRLALQENHAKYITTAELLNSFRKDYTDKTHMQLQYIPIQNVDDRGGEFVFIRR